MKEITLKDLPNVKAQEVFEYIVNNLIKQGKPSLALDLITNNYICSYRGSNGLKCAAGFLISDEDYKKEFEGVAYRRLVKDNYNFSENHLELIIYLQLIHDYLKNSNSFVSDLEKNISEERFLNQFNLNINFLKK